VGTLQTHAAQHQAATQVHQQQVPTLHNHHKKAISGVRGGSRLGYSSMHFRTLGVEDGFPFLCLCVSSHLVDGQ
jgi:hypothetical protein